jgi:hypothetical protein
LLTTVGRRSGTSITEQVTFKVVENSEANGLGFTQLG